MKIENIRICRETGTSLFLTMITAAPDGSSPRQIGDKRQKTTLARDDSEKPGVR